MRRAYPPLTPALFQKVERERERLLQINPRPAGMTVQEIMKVGREPTWVAIVNSIAGAGAVLVGGLVVKGRRKE